MLGPRVRGAILEMPCGCYGDEAAPPVVTGDEDGDTRGEVRMHGKVPWARIEVEAEAAADAPATGASWGANLSLLALILVPFF